MSIELTATPATAPESTPSPYGRRSAPERIACRRTQEDITAWLEEQEDAELAHIQQELASRNARAYRRDMALY